MGVRLSLLAPSAPTVAISSYVDILQNMQYIELINNCRFLKTIKAIDNSNGNLVIIKILIKPSANFSVNLHYVNELIIKEASLLSSYNNVLPWHKIIETDRAGYLVRQLVKTNLYDRLSIRPFLESIEKLFLVFQMLKINELLHSTLGIHHGDIKSENYLVTSWNWLMLTDFSEYTKPTFIPEDNPNQYSFYFDSSGRRVCYVAPERFYKSKQQDGAPAKAVALKFDDNGEFTGNVGLTDEMDNFSLGCVIAELYSDGEPTFTLSQLFKYMKQEYVPDLSGISDPNIKEIVKKLISINPSSRPSAATILHDYRGSCFPDFFYDFLYEFMSDLNNNDSFVVPDGDSNLSPSDLKLDKIYKNFDQISSHLGFDYPSQSNIQSDQPKHDDFQFIPLNLNLKSMPLNYNIQSSCAFAEKAKDPDCHASLIILSLIFSLLKTLKQPTSKTKACELIVALSERVNDEAKLDRSLPYLYQLLDEYIEQASSPDLYYPQQQENQFRSHIKLMQNSNVSSRVACSALTSITTLLASCSYITPLNVLIFPEYLLPIFNKLILLPSPKEKDGEKSLVKITLAACLPFLAQTSKRFWMMSKTFKNKAIKDYKNRLMIQSNILSGGLVSNDDEELLNSYNTFNIPKEQLDSDFENLAFSLLTDSNPNVKICLVSNILPLCKFFGITKTNDIILPHLITYLNDPNYQLRLAFLSSIIEIGPYVGVLSFEQYLLPLLIQTLGDQEQFIVLKVLEIFHHFVSNRLTNPKTEFNTLSIYKELLQNSLSLLLHPNEWIRQSVLSLVLSINENLSDADRYCFLYPLIKNFLSYDIATLDWNTIYPCLTRPLTRQVYEAAVTWCSNASSRSLFWQHRNFTAFTDINGNKKTAMRVVSFSKNMGKSVYVPQIGNGVNGGETHTTSDSKNGIENAMANVPLSPEDRQWILKLKSVGLDDKDLWKVFALRDYISHISRNHTSVSPLSTSQREFDLVKDVNISPRNIFFDVCFKTEPISNKSRTTETDIEGNEDNMSIRSRRDSNSLLLPNFGRAKASLQTIEANVFGELELGHDNSNGRGPATLGGLGTRDRHNISQRNHHHHSHLTKDTKSTHRVFSVTNNNIISNNMRHSYNGHNPFILNYLHNVDFDPTLDNFPEFGDVVKISGRPISSNGNSNSNTSSNTNTSFKPKGVVVAHINSNNRSDSIDGINVVRTCPTSEFFVTGSELGMLKIWDTSKLERNIISRTSILSTDLKSAIVDIRFMSDRFVFAVSTKDGLIRIFRIDLTRDKHKKIVKYNKMVLVRKAQLDEINDKRPTSLNPENGLRTNVYEETTNHSSTGDKSIGEYYANCLQFVITNSKSYLICTTTKSTIVGYDIIKMEKDFQLQNPLNHGIPNCFIVGHNNIWLLLGTSEGVLSLWDLRFRILIRSWKVKDANEDYHGKFDIKQLILLSPHFKIDKGAGTSGKIAKHTKDQENINTIHGENLDDGGIPGGNSSSHISTYFAMVGGNKDSDFIVWELPSFQCREVYNAYIKTPKIKQYKLEEIDENREITIDDIFSDLTVGLDQLEDTGRAHSGHNGGMTALSYFSKPGTDGRGGAEDYFISATHDRRLIVWNASQISESVALQNHCEVRGDGSTNGTKTPSETSFVRHKVNSTVSNVNEREVVGDRKGGSSDHAGSKKGGTQGADGDIKYRYDFIGHMDEITGVDLITKPFDMIVSVDRNGCINLYK